MISCDRVKEMIIESSKDYSSLIGAASFRVDRIPEGEKNEFVVTVYKTDRSLYFPKNIRVESICHDAFFCYLRILVLWD